MGRTPKVTREDALRGAMKLFWSRGYSATTLDDLQECIGLQRGSLYSYFKTKEALFHEALDLYHKDVVLERRECVRKAPSAKNGIEGFLLTLVDHSVKNRKNPGCLNTNTAAELSVIDRSIGDRSRRGLRSWEDFWIEILEKAKSTGEIDRQRNTRALARLIITITQGINVLSKVNPDRDYLNGIVKSSLEFLR